MKLYTKAEIIENTQIGPDIFKMILHCPKIADLARPGQFINVYPNSGELILPRPISICKKSPENLTIVYNVVGKGTLEFSKAVAGEDINIAGPLGNGFTILSDIKDKKTALMGGGMGVPPLLGLMEELAAAGVLVKVFLGFRRKDLIILENEFKELGAEVFIATDDGSQGFSGNILDCFLDSGFAPEEVYACGPKVMLKSIAAHTNRENISAQLSLEERMACGIGSCVGCVVKIKSGDGFIYKKVCSEGPVFSGDEVIFDE